MPVVVVALVKVVEVVVVMIVVIVLVMMISRRMKQMWMIITIKDASELSERPFLQTVANQLTGTK